MGNRGCVVVKETDKVSGVKIYTQHGAPTLIYDVQDLIKIEMKGGKGGVPKENLAELLFDYLREEYKKGGYSMHNIMLFSGDSNVEEWLVITIDEYASTISVSVDEEVVLQESLEEFVKDTKHLKHIC